jgi:methionyl-tRNA formyltransferase
MKIAILTSENQWFVHYSKELKNKLDNSELFFNHKEINDSYNIVFILSYHNIIEEKYLKLHKHNIVIHGSSLPKGKGWAPMFWQILENKKKLLLQCLRLVVELTMVISICKRI